MYGGAGAGAGAGAYMDAGVVLDADPLLPCALAPLPTHAHVLHFSLVTVSCPDPRASISAQMTHHFSH
jgi:hypothetical protein